MSEGNGHPYSWAAIFNGYHPDSMADCPFPVIPAYLAEQTFPEAAIPNVEVSHIWTQDTAISQHISASSRIPHIAHKATEMIGQVDGILLARDDAERHLEMARPFLLEGIPIFIDKPLALTRREAQEIFSLQQYEGQVFTCSSLRYASEFQPTEEIENTLGTLRFIEGIVPKFWNTYAVHIIEPALNFASKRGSLEEILPFKRNEVQMAQVRWSSGLSAVFKTMGSIKCPLEIALYGENGFIRLAFQDSFNAFKSSLEVFVEMIRTKTQPIPRKETLEIVEIIERGNG